MSACIAGGSSSSTSCGGVHRRCGSSVQVRNRPGSLSFPARSAVRKPCRAISSAVPAVRSPASDERGTEKLDYWMRESVVEIVKRLGSGEAAAAPLLVHVYGGEYSAIRIKTEQAEAEDWRRIRERWRSGEEPSPEGIILVEELKDETEADEGSLVKSEEGQGQNGENTKAWGVLLMGRGEEGGVASFLLKTTGGGSQNSRGGGYFCNCVHFSLVKVKSFRESTSSQLSNCWLVQAP